LAQVSSQSRLSIIQAPYSHTLCNGVTAIPNGNNHTKPRGETSLARWHSEKGQHDSLRCVRQCAAGLIVIRWCFLHETFSVSLAPIASVNGNHCQKGPRQLRHLNADRLEQRNLPLGRNSQHQVGIVLPKPAGRWRVSQTLLGGRGDIISQAVASYHPIYFQGRKKPLLTHRMFKTGLPEHPGRHDTILSLGSLTLLRGRLIVNGSICLPFAYIRGDLPLTCRRIRSP
jgi:hypothetical protein